jgi:hypothetical protein
MTDANFNNVFATIDEDGSGLIDKAELALFVRKLMSGDVKFKSDEVNMDQARYERIPTVTEVEPRGSAAPSSGQDQGIFKLLTNKPLTDYYERLIRDENMALIELLH